MHTNHMLISLSSYKEALSQLFIIISCPRLSLREKMRQMQSMGRLRELPHYFPMLLFQPKLPKSVRPPAKKANFLSFL